MFIYTGYSSRGRQIFGSSSLCETEPAKSMFGMCTMGIYVPVKSLRLLRTASPWKTASFCLFPGPVVGDLQQGHCTLNSTLSTRSFCHLMIVASTLAKRPKLYSKPFQFVGYEACGFPANVKTRSTNPTEFRGLVKKPYVYV